MIRRCGDRVPVRDTTEIFSIFGQLEKVAAEIMIERGEAKKIDAADIPASVAVNDAGTRAYFAVSMPKARVKAFDKLIRELRL